MQLTYIFKRQSNGLPRSVSVNYSETIGLGERSTIREAIVALHTRFIERGLVSSENVDRVQIYYSEDRISQTILPIPDVSSSTWIELGGEILPLDVPIRESVMIEGGHLCCILEGEEDEIENDHEVEESMDTEMRDFSSFLDTFREGTRATITDTFRSLFGTHRLADLEFEPVQALERPLIFTPQYEGSSLFMRSWESDGIQLRPLPENNMNLLNFIFGSSLQQEDVRVGLDPSIFDRFPRQTFGSFCSQSGNTSTSNETCTICLERHTDDTEVVILPCNHVFHPECIENWFQSSVRCPVCRAEAGEGRVVMN